MVIIGLREDLKSLFRQNIDVSFYDSLDGAQVSDGEMVLVDSHSVPADSLSGFGSGCTLVYLADNRTPAIVNAAQQIGMRIVTLEELDGFLASLVKRDPSLITFWGVYPQLGTTTIAASVGHYLVQHYDARVGMLQLNLYETGAWILPEAIHFLDDIKPFLNSGQLTPDQLRSSMNTFPSGLMYLAGNRNQTIALRYTMEEIRHLIDMAKRTFDIVVLDIGSVLNHSAAFQGLLSGTIYAVITDRLAAQNQFAAHQQHVLNPLGIRSEDIFLVGNRMHSRNQRTFTAFAEATGTTPLVQIPEMSEIAWYSEQQSNRLKGFLDEKGYVREIKRLAETVATHNAFQEVAATRR